MGTVNDRLQKVKQSLTFSSPSKGIEATSFSNKESISIQSSAMSNSIPSSINIIGSMLNSTAPPNTIALDSGAYSIKVGECTDKKPLTSVIPNCIMKAKAERKRVFIGNEIEDCRDLSGLYYQLPCDRGYVTRWDLQKTIWTHTVKPYLNDDTTLIMTQPILNFRESQEAIDEIFFEEYYIKALCRRYSSDYLVFNHMQRHGNDGTCIVVDSGYSSTWIVPYVGGVIYKKGLMRIDIGGKVLTNHMKEILSYRQLNVMEETYVINQMKEDACYVARSFSRDMQVAKKTGLENTIARTYVLPDFNTIRRGYIADPKSDMVNLANNYQLLKLNNERFTVPELLFQPSMIGFQQMGVAEAIAHTINGMPEYMQRTLCGNVVLSGGSTKLLGYKNRLGKDLRSLTPSKYAVELFVSADPVTWAWRCAASFAKVFDLSSHCVTRAQYEEYGSRFIYDKFEAPWNRNIEPTEPSFTEEIRPSILNYSGNVFAVQKVDDSEIIISDTEEMPLEKSTLKTAVLSVPALSPLTHNANQVQTRSSQAVLNCPPLIITGPSSQGRPIQSIKFQIKQCLTIRGGQIVDQTDECRTTQPVRQYSNLNRQSVEQVQEKKPMYVTDGKRLFRIDGPKSKATKLSSKPRVLNPGFVPTLDKSQKKLIIQRSTVAQVPSQLTKIAQEQQQKHPIWRLVGKIPRVQGLPLRLPSSSQTNQSNLSKQPQPQKPKPTEPSTSQIDSNNKQAPKPKPVDTSTTPIDSNKQLPKPKSAEPSTIPIDTNKEPPKPKLTEPSTSQIDSNKQAPKPKPTEAPTIRIHTNKEPPKPKTTEHSTIQIDANKQPSKPKPTEAPAIRINTNKDPKPKTTEHSTIVIDANKQPAVKPNPAATTSLASAPQRIILKRRGDLWKPKPVESTTPRVSASSSSPGPTTMQLSTLSKESILQLLQQVTRVILEPLPKSTIEAAAISSAAAYESTLTLGISSAESSVLRPASRASDRAEVEEDNDEMQNAMEEVSGDGDGERPARSRRGGRFSESTLKRRFED